MDSRSTVIMTRVAVAILLATDAFYLVVIYSQSDRVPGDSLTVPFIAAYMLVMAILLALSLSSRPRLVAVRLLLRAGPAGGLLLLGTLAALSIGLPILVASALAFVGTARSAPRANWRASAAFGFLAAVAAIVVLVAGIELGQRFIVCPSQGTSGGSGSGLVSGPYHWECVNGVLSYHTGS